IGTTTVTVTATDAAGNSTTKTFTVTVKDTTAPTVTISDITVEATSASGAVVNYTALISDAVGVVSVTYSKASGTIFGIGQTTVTITAKDAAGNPTIKTFKITVRDTTPPVFTFVSPNITVTTHSSSGVAVSYAAAIATDLVGPVTITYSKASGSTFAVGTTTV